MWVSFVILLERLVSDFRKYPNLPDVLRSKEQSCLDGSLSLLRGLFLCCQLFKSSGNYISAKPLCAIYAVSKIQGATRYCAFLCCRTGKM